MNIYTGNYKNCKNGNTISISRDKGEDANYNGRAYTKLAPGKDFWKIWLNNKGKISDEENNMFYMQKYYETVIKNLDAKEVYNELLEYGDDLILLCYEEPNDFCHRYLVAAWLELELGIKVDEVTYVDNKLKKLSTQYELKNKFKKIIKKQKI